MFGLLRRCTGRPRNGRVGALQVAVVGGLLLTVAALSALVLPSWANTDELVRQARKALAQQRYAEALRHCDRALQLNPQSVEAIIIAGGAAAAGGDAELAVRYYDRLTDEQNGRTADAQCVAAHLLLFELHRAADAEARYRRVLNSHPDHPIANSGLANLLGLSGRRWEAIPPTLKLLRQQTCTANQLILIGSESGGHQDPELMEKCLQERPRDPVALMGSAWHAAKAGRAQAAERLARAAVEAAPDLVQAHAQLGSLLLESSSDPEALSHWQAQLPREADEHPEIWLVRGDWARIRGEPETAIRCYWETLRRNPNYRTALYQLAQLLIARGEPQRAAPYLRRSEQLQRLKEAEAVLFEGVQTSVEPIRTVAERMQGLGRLWEAAGWCRIAGQLDPRASWPRAMIDQLRASLDGSPPLTLRSANPAFTEDLSDFPLPLWKSESGAPAPIEASAALTSASVSFRDDAAALGLDFTYFNSADPSTPGQRMYEFSGGGAAALDFDLDGWPDLYFTQGCEWPPQNGAGERTDRLFRNRSGVEFLDITEPAGLTETTFSQGTAAGDLDNDGFADVYVANIGKNRLYHNNGDGTFSDISAELGDDAERWTTSCAIADLNGDSLPDIYAVNYLQGEGIFDRVCEHKDGARRMCAPFDFDGAQDQFYLNRGDGRFEDATEAAGFNVPHGKGLGVAVGDFDGTGRPSVVVANDLVPNFLFTSRQQRRGGAPLFEEQGLASGLALNASGQAEGCMGIAVDDMNGDGRLDLMITNFLGESNTLYVQSEEGLFRDATAEAGLVQPTLPLLGFGTQCLDGELDGIPDLVVTNGHVDDLRAYGQPYHMRPQYFRGVGSGRFVELAEETLGSFFGGEYLGRGMARLDWNRDGREDVAISHLDSPAALLTNTTTGAGHFLAVQLRGVQCDRDAIGTSVTVRAGASSRTRQLTAGDGYQASNQRQLVFGLGSSTRVEAVEIRWPGGPRQEFLDVPVDCELLFIEGADRPVRFRGRAAAGAMELSLLPQ